MTHSDNKYNQAISQDDFGRIVMDRLHETNAAATVIYDRQHFCLRGDADDILNLGELYKGYCVADDKARVTLLSDVARIWFREDYTLPEDFADAAHDLMPYVHARSFYEIHSGNWPYRVLGEHFGVALAFERLESRQLVTQDNLDTWGVSLDDALETAKENLRNLPTNIARPTSGDGAWWMMTGDERSSSYLLLTDVIQQCSVQGDIIVMVPNRDTLFIAGSDDIDALKQMLVIATAAPKQLRPISNIALRLSGDTWEPWLPDESHPLYQDFRELHLHALEEAYAAQEKMFDERHNETGQQIHVGSFKCLRRPDGTLASAVPWPADVESLLPMTDVIMFIRDYENVGIVTFQGALSVVGNLMERLEMYPPRYRVRAFPSEDQLEWMVSEHSGEGIKNQHDSLGAELKENAMKFGEFEFDNMASMYFFLWLIHAKCNPDLQNTIARAIDPTLRNDKEVLEGWITPAYLLAWDLLTWLLEKVTDWCETQLPDAHPLGWLHLISNRDALQGDPDHNLLFAALMGSAASMINFDQVAEALLIKAGGREEMHVALRELESMQGKAKVNRPERPYNKQPRDENGKLTTRNMVTGMARDHYDKHGMKAK